MTKKRGKGESLEKSLLLFNFMDCTTLFSCVNYGIKELKKGNLS